MPKTYHTPLRSNFALVNNAAALGQTKQSWTLRDILAEKNALARREKLFAKADEKAARKTTGFHVARVKKIKKADGGGFHVLGLGKVAATTMEALRGRLKRANSGRKLSGGKVFTHIKMGAIFTKI